MKLFILTLVLLSTQAFASERNDLEDFIRTDILKGETSIKWVGTTPNGKECRFKILDLHGIRLDLSANQGQSSMDLNDRDRKPSIRQFNLNRNDELTSLSLYTRFSHAGNYLFAKSSIYSQSLKIKKVNGGYYFEAIESKGFIPKERYRVECLITDFTPRSGY